MDSIFSAGDCKYENGLMAFDRLLEIKGVDHQKISLGVAEIEDRLTNDEFYANSNSCLNSALDYIITHAYFLIKDPKSGQILLTLINLLKNIIFRVRDALQVPEYFLANKDRVLITLNNLMDSHQENYAKVEGGRIINALLEMKPLHTEKLKDLYELAFKSFIAFDEENAFLDLSRLTRILLKQGLANCEPLIKWMDTKCVAYLKMANEYTKPQEILELLNCLLTYYETRDQTIVLQKVVTNNLKSLLFQLCAYLNNRLFRNTAEQLLMYLVYELYCTCTSICPYGKMDILAEIQNLPDNYEEWPASTSTTFFVFAYLQLLHSRCLWEHNVILEAANSYLSLHPLVPSGALKALSWLYPVVSTENSSYDYNIRKRLFTTLMTHKSLGSVLTFDSLQMGWLLRQADATLKTRLLTAWLHAKSDDEILKVLNSTTSGHLVLENILMCPDSAISSRILEVIVRLETYPVLATAVGTAITLFCDRVDIYSLFLQMKPAVPCNPTEILSSIKIVSACMPFLTEDVAVQAGCAYSMSLLRALKDESDAVLQFCNFSATLKFLAVRCASEDDVTAISAIMLLKRLTTIQYKSKTISVDIHIPVDFINILQGNSERLHIGLQLLRIVLSSRSRQLILTCPKNLSCGLCHLLCSLVAKKQELFLTFDILKLLMYSEPNLSFSLAIPYTLRIICTFTLEQKCRNIFLLFLKIWLTQVLDILYVDVPTDLLKSFLQQFPQNTLLGQVHYLLDKYERFRW